MDKTNTKYPKSLRKGEFRRVRKKSRFNDFNREERETLKSSLVCWESRLKKVFKEVDTKKEISLILSLQEELGGELVVETQPRNKVRGGDLKWLIRRAKDYRDHLWGTTILEYGDLIHYRLKGIEKRLEGRKEKRLKGKNEE
jgi:hypothetical protein